VFCDVAPHNLLYGGICCLPPSSEISEDCRNLYSLPDIVKDKIEEGEFGEIFGKHDKD